MDPSVLPPSTMSSSKLFFLLLCCSRCSSKEIIKGKSYHVTIAFVQFPYRRFQQRVGLFNQTRQCAHSSSSAITDLLTVLFKCLNIALLLFVLSSSLIGAIKDISYSSICIKVFTFRLIFRLSCNSRVSSSACALSSYNVWCRIWIHKTKSSNEQRVHRLRPPNRKMRAS